jgi:hypothetical protein
LGVGLIDRAVTLEELETGQPLVAPTRKTPLVAYIWAINLREGDVVHIELMYQGKVVVKNVERLERDKAQFMLFAGKKAPPGGWLEGTYSAAVEVSRDGRPVIKESRSVVLQ